MEIAKPAEDEKEYFRSLLDHLPGIDINPMFGNLAAFVNGNMFCGLLGSDVGVRAELLAVPGAGPFGSSGRPMEEYVSLPSQWRNTTDEPVDAWMHRALEHAAAMPPKKPKQKPKSTPAT